jgi:quaternary ammonium compound-resistance protein SugE
LVTNVLKRRQEPAVPLNLNTKITQSSVSCQSTRLFLHSGHEDDLYPLPSDAAFSDNPGRPVYKKEGRMAWITLIAAGLFEIGWAIGLKYTEGFSKLVPSVLTAVSMVISVVLLGLALRELPVGSAYAVWTGIGTVGTALLGMYIFGEPATVTRLICIGLIVAGIGGLKFLS